MKVSLFIINTLILKVILNFKRSLALLKYGDDKKATPCNLCLSILELHGDDLVIIIIILMKF